MGPRARSTLDIVNKTSSSINMHRQVMSRTCPCAATAPQTIFSHARHIHAKFQAGCVRRCNNALSKSSQTFQPRLFVFANCAPELDREGYVRSDAFGQCTSHSVKAGFDDRRRAFPCAVCPRELCRQFKYYGYSKT